MLLMPAAAFAQNYQAALIEAPPATLAATSTTVPSCFQPGDQGVEYHVRPSVDTSKFVCPNGCDKPDCTVKPCCGKFPTVQASTCEYQIECVYLELGTLLQGCTITVTPTAELRTGGHLHPDANNTALPPAGSFASPTATTGANGVASFVYTAAQASGIVDVTSTGTDPFGRALAPLTVRFGVETDGFTALPLPVTGARYAIASSTAHDSNNRYVKPDVAEHLKVDVPDKFADELAKKNITTPPVITYTSLSLPFGGVFDVHTSKSPAGVIDNEWNPPHCAHRDGTVADIDLNTFPPDRRRELQQGVCKAGFDFPVPKERFSNPGADYWHARWRPGGTKQGCQ